MEACVAADVPFGVKSGGHGHYAGQSCLDAGIQFDLCRLNSITLTPEKRTVRVGAGCTWRSIYEVLEPQGVTAVGGRSADVGVGGFLIGGMLTFMHHLEEIQDTNTPIHRWHIILCCRTWLGCG